MRLCQFERNDTSRAIGIAVDDTDAIADATGIHGALKESGASSKSYDFPSELMTLIADGPEGLDAAAEVAEAVAQNVAQWRDRGLIQDYSKTQICAPVSRPQKFFAIAINRHGGWDTAIKPDNPHPTYFVKLSSCIVGPHDAVRIPDVGQVGPEIELLVVIGKGGRDIPEDEALQHVFGYAVHNDITAHQMRKTSEWIRMVREDGSEEHLTYPGRYKNFDTFSPIGPWLVTADAVSDPDNMRLKAWLNDDLVQDGSTSGHVFNTAHLISYLSRAHALEPGDIISTGTVGAVAPWRMATIDLGKIGGTLHSEIEGLGRMANPIEFVPGLA